MNRTEFMKAYTDNTCNHKGENTRFRVSIDLNRNKVYWQEHQQSPVSGHKEIHILTTGDTMSYIKEQNKIVNKCMRK